MENDDRAHRSPGKRRKGWNGTQHRWRKERRPSRRHELAGLRQERPMDAEGDMASALGVAWQCIKLNAVHIRRTTPYPNIQDVVWDSPRMDERYPVDIGQCEEGFRNRRSVQVGGQVSVSREIRTDSPGTYRVVVSSSPRSTMLRSRRDSWVEIDRYKRPVVVPKT